MKSISKGKYRCKQCGKVMGQKNKRRHMMIHQGLKPFKCSYCDKRFLEKNDCIAHERNHTGVMHYHCSCSKAYSSRKNLLAHQHYYKSSLHYQRFPCKTCSEVFDSVKEMNQHRLDSHPEVVSEYVCNICCETFKSDMERNRHRLDSHPNLISEHVCKLCLMDFTTVFKLNRHAQRMHQVGNDKDNAGAMDLDDRNGPLPEDDEVRKISHRRGADDHPQESSGKHLCNVCLKFYSTPSCLYRHMRQMHGESSGNSNTKQSDPVLNKGHLMDEELTVDQSVTDESEDDDHWHLVMEEDDEEEDWHLVMEEDDPEEWCNTPMEGAVKGDKIPNPQQPSPEAAQ